MYQHVIIFYEDNKNSVEAKKSFICTPCRYLCCKKSHLVQHYSSKKHIYKINNPDAVDEFMCENCDKTYTSNQGLWFHKKNCKSQVTVVIVTPVLDLHAKIDNLEKIIIEMAKNLNTSSEKIV